MNLNFNQSKKKFQEKNVTQKFTERIEQNFEKEIRKIGNNTKKFRKVKFSKFKIIEKFKKVAVYQKFSITSAETNFMLVDATNVKSQKNVFVLDTTFTSNKLAKMNFVIKSKLKRSIMNISKSSSKVILSREKNVIDFEK